MIMTTRHFKQIDREYKITSAELRKALKLEGEIICINLYSGRTSLEAEQGKSPETDLWEIKTEEIQKVKNK